MRPVTVHVVAPVVVQVRPPGEAVTVYPVMADPSSDAGAVHDTVACSCPATAVTAVGTVGTSAGVTDPVVFDGGESPAAFVALTVKV